MVINILRVKPNEKIHDFASRLKTDNVTKKGTAKHIRSIHQKEDKTDQKNARFHSNENKSKTTPRIKRKYHEW